MTRALVTALSGLVISVFPARAQDSTAKRVDAATAASARKLLTATGATKLMLGNLESMIAAQRDNPQIPPGFLDALLAHARRDTTRLVDLLVPIYASHLTQSELEELLKFYNSPIGQRLTSVQPDIFKETMAAGEGWFEQIARAVSDSLDRAKGSKPPQQ